MCILVHLFSFHTKNEKINLLIQIHICDERKGQNSKLIWIRVGGHTHWCWMKFFEWTNSIFIHFIVCCKLYNKQNAKIFKIFTQKSSWNEFLQMVTMRLDSDRFFFWKSCFLQRIRCNFLLFSDIFKFFSLNIIKLLIPSSESQTISSEAPKKVGIHFRLVENWSQTRLLSMSVSN